MTPALAPPAPIVITCNPWCEPLYQYPSPYDYRVIHGGRGSSKTNEVTRALSVHGHNQPLRICVAREHLKSINESAKPELEERMREMDLIRDDAFTVTNNFIDHANGTHIFFIGLSRMSEEDIKGLAMVDILWIEEAHRMSKTSWELVDPTIQQGQCRNLVDVQPTVPLPNCMATGTEQKPAGLLGAAGQLV